MTKMFIEKDLGSELMLYDPERDEVHVLNASAQLIYKLYCQGGSLEEIEQVLRQTYRIRDELDIRATIEECLTELGKKKLVAQKG